MSLLDIAKKRYSVRKYSDQPIEREKLDQILEIAHVAPTAANKQPVRLLVVQSKSELNRIGKAANIYGAPTAIVVCADRSEAWTRPFDGMVTTSIDASILTDHMMLQATELGLGSVWICYFNPEILKEELQLPPEWEPVNILALGYAADMPADPNRHESQRISFEKLVTFR
ncbi:MAG: nitroreductase family protein [Clostridia bacterium]|nr:nitroreductase family protein [Clostridia bacterium]